MLYSLLKPLLFRLEAERAHALIGRLLAASAHSPLPDLLRAAADYTDSLLNTSCAGLQFHNPIGLAAGFDKRAALIRPMAALGFGHLEIGTVTPRAQPGNDRPRLFRLVADGALINRLGFNSPGMLAVARTLRDYRQGQESQAKNQSTILGSRFSAPAAPIIGVNIGKNRDTPLDRAVDDYRATFLALAPMADYVTLNISSPNTPGLRKLHQRAALETLLGEIVALNNQLAHPRPLFLKVSPDESPDQLAQAAQASAAAGLAGLIATNTTVARDRLRSAEAGEAGGLSGRPLHTRSRQTIAQLFALTGGRLPIVGVGGVSSGTTAYTHIRAGASLVQLYTGLVYEGPALVYTIKRELAQLLRRDGYRSVAEAVGASNR